MGISRGRYLPKASMSKPVRVLVVDDSALVRKILVDGFSKDPGIEVVGQASNPYMARDLMVDLKPDVITLDVEMPKMDGVTFLKRFMPIMPIPTIIISSLTQEGKRITFDALEAGAVDVVTKPVVGLVDGMPPMMEDICRRVKAAAGALVGRHLPRKAIAVVEEKVAMDETTDRVMAIGSSTGGVEALSRIMPAFPADTPGIVIVQHMPGGFTHSFADRLNGLCKMRVKEAEQGDRIVPGCVYIAPGGLRHMTVIRSGGQYRIDLKEGPEVCYSRPSVDVLFNSIAKEVGRNAVAAVLTGMGKDGAEGLLNIRRSGGRTFAQDQATSVVYGMPQVALQLGGAEAAVPLDKIPLALTRALHNTP